MRRHGRGFAMRRSGSSKRSAAAAIPPTCRFPPASGIQSLAGKRLSEVTSARKLAPTVENAADTVLWMIEQGECLAHLPRHRRAGPAANSQASVDDDRVGRRHSGLRAGQPASSVLRHVRARARALRARAQSHHARGCRAQDVGISCASASAWPTAALLQEGLKADLVVFDADTVRDTATYSRPHQYAEGVSLVVVNGEIVFENGRMTAARPGRVLTARRASGAISAPIRRRKSGAR